MVAQLSCEYGEPATLRDGWDSELVIEPVAPGNIAIRSAGPDRRVGTADDLLYSRTDEQRLALEFRGCYAVVSTASDLVPSVFELDATPIDYSGFALRPDRGYAAPGWRPLSSDSVNVWWAGTPGFGLRLARVNGELRGVVWQLGKSRHAITVRPASCEGIM